MAKMGRKAGLGGVGRNAVRRFAVAASGFAALGVGWGGWAKSGEDAENAAREEAFFEILWRCESPLLVERNEAEDALFERFAGFESVWQDRRFLTNGEIGAEARQRFELAEARYREKAFDDCAAAFKATFETVATEAEEARKREDAGEKKERNEENGGNEKNGENGETLRGRVLLRWEKPLRIVYLAPDWSAFERRDALGTLWRPSGRFSAPELAPEFDASELTLETTWERVDEEKTTLSGQNEENRGNGEGKTAVVGALEGLIGGDFRVWTLPIGAVARENAGIGEDREDERGERAAEKRETASDGGVDFPTIFQSGNAVATVGKTTINANGETTARARFDFAEAFDAFDSHRVWCDKQDFALIIDDGGDNWEVGGDIDASGTENAARSGAEEGEKKKTSETDETSETNAGKRRWEARRMRVRERSANGALFELDFPNDAALREAVAQGRARLLCRIPRFFFWTRIEIDGIEKTTDVEEEAAETEAEDAGEGAED
jgi:hypothetical protein